MAIDVSNLRVVQYPDPVLRKVAKAVKEITPEVREVVARMFELMKEEEGIGLAAPQVGLSWRLFIAQVPESDDRSASSVPPTATKGPRVYINPVLSLPSGAVEPFEEGCLSLPDIRGTVLRPPVITIKAKDLDGKVMTEMGAGLLARCWQHELDHLDGVLILDRMLQADKMKNRIKVRDLERNAEPSER